MVAAASEMPLSDSGVLPILSNLLERFEVGVESAAAKASGVMVEEVAVSEGLETGGAGLGLTRAAKLSPFFAPSAMILA